MSDGKEILAIAMKENDANAETIRGYLVALLDRLWEEGEGFSGKRPFGNSGWEYDLYKPLVRSGKAKGKIDDYGDLEDVDSDECNELIFTAIAELGRA